MFGESESESPRAGSPWDKLLLTSDPPSPLGDNEVVLTKSPRVLPKLVPEIEEGNVEYKLRLLNPTSERFTRLVTQLKWRLLEGGGQAYYELGVADSGQLVGLTREHLEQTLQTLEEMAGEIGASVIIVKEIELPAALGGGMGAENQRGRIADGAMRMPKKRVADYVDTSSAGESVDEETELSTPEGEDELDDFDAAFLGPLGWKSSSTAFHQRTHPDRPTAQSSPIVLPVDASGLDAADDSWVLMGDLEISSVYKPRPSRRRTPTPPTRTTSRAAVNKPTTTSVPMDIPKGKAKWNNRRSKRSGKVKADKLKNPKPVVNVEPVAFDSGPPSASVMVPQPDERSDFDALDELEDALALLSFDNTSAPSIKVASGGKDLQICPTVPFVTPSVARSGSSITSTSADVAIERLFIVEALVVRKMSLEEAFLDFGRL